MNLYFHINILSTANVNIKAICYMNQGKVLHVWQASTQYHLQTEQNGSWTIGTTSYQLGLEVIS